MRARLIMAGILRMNVRVVDVRGAAVFVHRRHTADELARPSGAMGHVGQRAPEREHEGQQHQQEDSGDFHG